MNPLWLWGMVGTKEGLPLPTAYRNPSVVGHYKVPANDSGLKTKLQIMQEFVEIGKRDPNLYAFVRQLLRASGVPGKDQKGEIECIVSYCEQNVDYRRDTNGIEVFSHPLDTLNWGGGDCDDMAVLICCLLELVGFKTRFKVVQTKNANGWNHVFAEVEYPRGSGRYISIDATMPQYPVGWEVPKHMVSRSLSYAIGGVRMPNRESIDPSGMTPYYDYVGSNMVYDHPENLTGLDGWFDDLTHAVSVNWSSLTKTVGATTQKISSVAKQAGDIVSKNWHDAYNDIRHAQLPPAVRKSAIGQYVTKKSKEWQKALHDMLNLSPLHKAIAWASVGNLYGAYLVVKAHPDEVLREMPGEARNFVTNLRNDIDGIFSGTKTTSGLDGLGYGDLFGYVGLGDLGGTGMLSKIKQSWDHLSHAKKNEIIALLVVLTIITLVVLYFVSPAVHGWLDAAGHILLSVWHELEHIFGPDGAWGVVMAVFTWIISLFKKSPSTPAAIATTPPPETTTTPPPDETLSMLGFGSGSSGATIGAAVLLGLLALA